MKPEIKNIAIFCASSNALESHYYDMAEQIADQFITKNYNLVFGGSNVGLMNTLASKIVNENGKVIGIIPESIAEKGLTFQNATEIFITKDMRTRKDKISEISDAYIALPGGFGTLDEIIEVIVHKQLHYHNKPIIIFNYHEFYNDLLNLFHKFYSCNFAKSITDKLFFVTNNITEIFTYIQNYEGKHLDEKWYKVDKQHFGEY